MWELRDLMRIEELLDRWNEGQRVIAAITSSLDHLAKQVDAEGWWEQTWGEAMWQALDRANTLMLPAAMGTVAADEALRDAVSEQLTLARRALSQRPGMMTLNQTLHPAVAERLVELEALGLTLADAITIAHEVMMTLACTSTEGRDRWPEYIRGRVDEAAQMVAQASDVRQSWQQDWEIRRRDGKSPTLLLMERRERIEKHLADNQRPQGDGK